MLQLEREIKSLLKESDSFVITVQQKNITFAEPGNDTLIIFPDKIKINNNILTGIDSTNIIVNISPSEIVNLSFAGENVVSNNSLIKKINSGEINRISIIFNYEKNKDNITYHPPPVSIKRFNNLQWQQ